MPENRVTVIIPNYNGKKFLKTCMDALQKQTFQSFETLVIDNASTDDSVEFLKQEYPWVRIAVMHTNLGFAGGVNAGIRMAKTEYVLLLNNDTRVHRDFIKELVKTMDSSDDIFSVSSRMLQFYNRDLMDDAGDLYTALGWAFQRGVGQSLSEYRQPCDVFSACAGAALYRKRLFPQVGLLDELHFAYLEDIDLGYRARIHGYRNVYCPTAVVYHVGSGTSGSKYNAFKVRLSARNSIYLPYKNMPLLQLLLNAPTLLVGYWIKGRFFRSLGFEKEYWEGIREGIQTRKKCKRVFFQSRHIRNYIQIQMELWRNTLIYIAEFSKRRLLP